MVEISVVIGSIVDFLQEVTDGSYVSHRERPEECLEYYRSIVFSQTMLTKSFFSLTEQLSSVRFNPANFHADMGEMAALV